MRFTQESRVRTQLMLGLWVIVVLGSALAPMRVLAQAPRASEPAGSAEPAGYRPTVEQALAEYAAKNYEEASALFGKAHALYPNARTLRGLGMAAFELRRYEESIPYLEGALSAEAKALDGQLRSDTEALLVRAQSFVARVSVSLSPASAALAVDGKPVTQALSAPLLLTLGEHALSAEAEGYRPERKNLRVRGGEVLRIDLILQKGALEAAVPPKNSQDKPRRLVKSPWLWTAVGAVVIGAAALGVLVATRGDAEQQSVPVSDGNAHAAVLRQGLWSR